MAPPSPTVTARRHMAESDTRAKTGNLGACIGTRGPAGSDSITGLYLAIADRFSILCITGQAPRARPYEEGFQAVDIESISKPITQWSVTQWGVTVREPAQVPRACQQAFHLMRPGRPDPAPGLAPAAGCGLRTLGPTPAQRQQDLAQDAHAIIGEARIKVLAPAPGL